jgi:adenylosuccinate lyase
MGRIWSLENKYRQWLEVELAASEALAELGEVPADAARALRTHAAFDVERIEAIEAEVKHDVIAFTTAVSEKLAAAGAADSSRWLHFGLTSNDVVDTAQALQLKEASGLIRGELGKLHAVLGRRAHEFKDTVTAGRTGFTPSRRRSASSSPTGTRKSAARCGALTTPPSRCGSAKSRALSAHSLTSARGPRS